MKEGTDTIINYFFFFFNFYTMVLKKWTQKNNKKQTKTQSWGMEFQDAKEVPWYP